MQGRVPVGTRLQQGMPSGANPHRMNAMQIKEQEALNKERQRQDEYNAERQTRVTQSLSAPYQQVGSRVNTTGQAPKPTRAQAVEQQQQMQHHSTVTKQKGSTDDVEINVFVNECADHGTMFSMMESAGKQLSPNQKDGSPYGVHKAPVQNTANSNRAPLARSNAPNTTPGQVHRGEVPKYLQQRKAQAQADKDEIDRLKAEEAEKAKYPPGHRPFTEEERTDLLTKLATRKKELEYDLVRIPVRVDTLAVKKRRAQIEKELEEVEQAVAKFSVKKQLYVPC